MVRTLVLLSLVTWRFGEAATTTPACGDLCKGLVGGAAGLAGLGAIGGIVAASMGTDKPATLPPAPTPAPTPAPPGTLPSTVAPTVGPTVPATLAPTFLTTSPAPRGASDSSGSDSSGSWLWPLLLGLLALCCLGALLGFLCMGKPKKATKKRTTKVKKPTPAPVVHAEPEAAPLMSTGHYEQPMMTVPVGTTTPSYMPTMVETVAPASAYMPSYGMMPTVMESYMPTVAPTYAASPMYGTSTIV